jgi:hypothetical protein
MGKDQVNCTTTELLEKEGSRCRKGSLGVVGGMRWQSKRQKQGGAELAHSRKCAHDGCAPDRDFWRGARPRRGKHPLESGGLSLPRRARVEWAMTPADWLVTVRSAIESLLVTLMSPAFFYGLLTAPARKWGAPDLSIGYGVLVALEQSMARTAAA